MNENLLIELLVEELPPKALQKLSDAFSGVLLAQLQAQGLTTAQSVLTSFATPRRLAAHISLVLPRAANKAVSQKLMPVSVGLDATGAATPALLKRLQTLGLDAAAVSGLRRAPDGKVEALFCDSMAAGVTLTEGVQKALNEAIAKLPTPKVMSYQLHQGCELPGWSSVNFVRPAHRLMILHGAQVLPVNALGLNAGRTTLGHRFEAVLPELQVAHADDYERQLATQGAVVASYALRRGVIQAQLKASAAKAGAGLSPIEDEALLDEVTALVERPNVLICQFEPEFLAVPQECLILTMKANQKYFPLLDASGKLSNQFLVVSNINPADASAVIEGNERVVRPRLADAKFFYDQDRKKSLAERALGLGKVVYHNKLGTQAERSERVRAIAHAVVQQLRDHTTPYTAASKDEMDMLAHKAEQAALLAKADLLTDMVGEFPELQGIMGGYYARHEGLRDGVAIAIEDHYKPRFAGDALPRNHTGTVVALADKLETLVGMFGIGNLPTGDKDPFALRRHALGVIRILVEKQLAIDLPTLINASAACFGCLISVDAAKLQADLLGFVFDRFAGSLREQGYSAQEVDAVLSLQPRVLSDVSKRLAAVRSFAALPEAAALAAANKRVGNILKKSDPGMHASIIPSLLLEPAEQALHEALQSAAPVADAAFESGDYSQSLSALAVLKAPVDAFFEHVMVNAEDPALKANRLGLLTSLHQAMNRVADLSKLVS
jgi:glycyl-tRNA synthetase beta chain